MSDEKVERTEDRSSEPKSGFFGPLLIPTVVACVGVATSIFALVMRILKG